MRNKMILTVISILLCMSLICGCSSKNSKDEKRSGKNNSKSSIIKETIASTDATEDKNSLLNDILLEYDMQGEWSCGRIWAHKKDADWESFHESWDLLDENGNVLYQLENTSEYDSDWGKRMQPPDFVNNFCLLDSYNLLNLNGEIVANDLNIKFYCDYHMGNIVKTNYYWRDFDENGMAMYFSFDDMFYLIKETENYNIEIIPIIYPHQIGYHFEHSTLIPDEDSYTYLYNNPGEVEVNNVVQIGSFSEGYLPFCSCYEDQHGDSKSFIVYFDTDGVIALDLSSQSDVRKKLEDKGINSIHSVYDVEDGKVKVQFSGKDSKYYIIELDISGNILGEPYLA